LYYWFEVLVHNWPVLIFSEVALILIIIQSPLFESEPSNELKKCPSYENLIEDPNFKLDDKDIKSTKNPILSSIVIKQ
jgi:hypothetical protein